MMTIEDDILNGLSEFRDSLADGSSPGKLTIRKVRLMLQPTDYSPELVKTTRQILGVSQAVFAKFIGVSSNAVQAWEQGGNPATGAAARLMDEIRLNPEYWRKRLLESAQQVNREI